MRNKWLALLLLTATCAMAQDYKIAQPGYTFAFPRDYFNREDYQTEWWYYTGNVKSADGQRFGFELTFCRQVWVCTASQAHQAARDPGAGWGQPEGRGRRTCFALLFADPPFDDRIH